MSPEQRELLIQIDLHGSITEHCKGIFYSWKLGDFGAAADGRTAEALREKGFIRLSRETKTGFRFVMSGKGRKFLEASRRMRGGVRSI